MKKSFMILVLGLPLMAQEGEAKESVGETVVRVIQDAEWSKSKSAHQRDHEKKHGKMKRINRSDRHKTMNKRIAMAKRKKMDKKRKFRSAVRLVVISGIAYSAGIHEGKKHGKAMKHRAGRKKQ